MTWPLVKSIASSIQSDGYTLRGHRDSHVMCGDYYWVNNTIIWWW
jgi:hypothetical protein